MNALPKPMSLDDFLVWEARQELRWEYDGFAARAMTGGTSAHALIQARLIGLLFGKLEGSPCRAFGSQLKVRTATSVRYPDALIVCGRIAPDATHTDDADVVFEILSKSSAVDDLGSKNVEYRTLPSLKLYVVLHQSHAAAEIFRRDGDDSWTYEFITSGGVLDLAEVGCAVALAELYSGVEFPA